MPSEEPREPVWPGWRGDLACPTCRGLLRRLHTARSFCRLWALDCNPRHSWTPDKTRESFTVIHQSSLLEVSGGRVSRLVICSTLSRMRGRARSEPRSAVTLLLSFRCTRCFPSDGVLSFTLQVGGQTAPYSLRSRQSDYLSSADFKESEFGSVLSLCHSEPCK